MSGAHVRCLETLNGLIKLNCEIIFISSTMTSETKWNSASIEHLKKMGVRDVKIYKSMFIDLFFTSFRKLYSLFNLMPPLSSFIYSPPLFRMWFKKIQSTTSPEIIWMNYSYWDRLVDRKKRNNSILVIDYYDLVSRNYLMQKEISKYILKDKSSLTLIDDRILNEDFFSDKNYSVESEEFKIITSYDKIVAISSGEEDAIKRSNPLVNVIHIPVTYEPSKKNNLYNGPAIFVTGPNLFNIQGFFYFTKKVFPIIQQKSPEIYHVGNWFRPKVGGASRGDIVIRVRKRSGKNVQHCTIFHRSSPRWDRTTDKNN